MSDAPYGGERILIVDDDAQVRSLLVLILDHDGYRCTPAASLAEARGRLADDAFDMILCDVRLPDGSGLDLVEELLAGDVQMAAVMVSGLDDIVLAERALRIGAYGYVVKPFTANDVLIGVLGALRLRQRELESAAEIRTWQEETIQRLCIAVEARDHETATHINQMSVYSRRIAARLGLEQELCDRIRIASPMHDVGKIGVPDRILLKPGPLTADERAEMERHAEVGYRILGGSRAPVLQTAAAIAWTHHERVDGTGYPRGLTGDEIPIEGRIAAVADVFDALTRDRVYRRRFSRRDALAFMHEGNGTRFDPEVLDAFLALEGERPAVVA